MVHSMNMVRVDLSLNKVLFKTSKDVEAQLMVNLKFEKEKERIKKDQEMKEMEASRIELRRSHRK